MTAALEAVMHEFLVRRLGCEVIDSLVFPPGEGNSSRADYFFHDRTVIIEVKSLVDDRAEVVRATLAKYRRQPDWPDFRGESDVQELLARHPRGPEISKELTLKISRVISRACLSADRQIGETKRVFALPQSMGVLILLNDHVDVLDPAVTGSQLASLLRGRGKNGSRRYAHLDSAIAVDWAHYSSDQGPGRETALLVCPADDPSEEQLADSFEPLFTTAWASFIRQPLRDGGRFTAPEELDALKFAGRFPTQVIDLDQLGDTGPQ
jgi:hypothetical protein